MLLLLVVCHSDQALIQTKTWRNSGSFLPDPKWHIHTHPAAWICFERATDIWQLGWQEIILRWCTAALIEIHLICASYSGRRSWVPTAYQDHYTPLYSSAFCHGVTNVSDLPTIWLCDIEQDLKRSTGTRMTPSTSTAGRSLQHPDRSHSRLIRRTKTLQADRKWHTLSRALKGEFIDKLSKFYLIYPH